MTLQSLFRSFAQVGFDEVAAGAAVSLGAAVGASVSADAGGVAGGSVSAAGASVGAGVVGTSSVGPVCV